MRKLILFNMISLDGYFAGPQGDLDWHHTDDEFNRFSAEQIAAAGGLLFGRRTYELMASFWPTPAALEGEPLVAEKMNRLSKYVFSRTLHSVDWHNTQLLTGDAAAAVNQLKQQPGLDLYLMGSANLAASLIPHSLIDEYRLMLNPVVLGSGQPLFQGQPGRLELRLADMRTFQNGNLLLTYHPTSTGKHA